MTLGERVPLGRLLRRPPRYGINAAAVPLKPGIATYIRITDIDEAGRFVPKPKVGVARPGAAKYRLAPGELVFARTGASVGKSYLYDPADGELVYAGFLINIAPDPKQLDPRFLSLYVQTKEYWDWIARTSMRSGQPGVNGREYATLLVPIPDLATQQAIADAVGDVDRLIRSLERLTAKRQAIKQGMMQQLLTGATRLPGFSEPWRLACTLGQSCDRISGYWGADEPQSPGDVPAQVIRAGDISVEGKLLDSAHRYFKPAEWKKAACHVDDVVITTSGNGLGKSFYVRGTERLAASNFVRILRPRPGVAGEFIGYLMLTERARSTLDTHTATSAYPNLLPSFFSDPWFGLPALDEQLAIATALRSVDDCLDGLKKRLHKARDIKLGMMQQLLTGRTHLPMEAAS